MKGAQAESTGRIRFPIPRVRCVRSALTRAVAFVRGRLGNEPATTTSSRIVEAKTAGPADLKSGPRLPRPSTPRVLSQSYLLERSWSVTSTERVQRQVQRA